MRVIPYLEANGVDCKRLTLQAAESANVDAVIFQKAYGPAEQMLARKLSSRGVRLLLDLCDHHLWTHPDYPETILRRDNLLRMLELVDVVTCSTPSLAKEVPHSRIHIVDDCLEDIVTTSYARWITNVLTWGWSANSRRKVSQRIIWFGNAGSDFPPFGLSDLPQLFSALQQIHLDYPLELTVVSSSHNRFCKFFRNLPFRTRYVSWRRWMMPILLAQHDICAIPISDNVFTRCKTVNRAAFALQCGLPVVAQPIPSYQELAKFIEIGDLESGLRRVIESPELSKQKVHKGQEFLLTRFAADRIALQWIGAIDSALSIAPPEAEPGHF